MSIRWAKYGVFCCQGFVRGNAVKWLGMKERRIELLCWELAVLIKMSNWRYFNTD